MSTVTVHWINDDLLNIEVDGVPEVSIDYDNHGTDGMRVAVQVAETLAARLGATFETKGTPGR